MAKRAAGKKASGGGAAGWTRRALGLVLCAFFGLGMATGLSQAGRAFAARMRVALFSYWAELSQTLIPWRGRAAEGALIAPGALSPSPPAGGAIALVERHDGFYALFAAGELRGPVEPAAEGDLPILSGAPVRTADAEELVPYAATLVRSEAALAGLVSEMRLNGAGTASLFFDRSHTELRMDLDGAPAELSRAAEVLRRWRGHERMIALLDMTTPGQAVMRLRGMTPGAMRGGAARGAAETGGARLVRAGGGSARR